VLDQTVVVLDFETTGLQIELGDRVTEVAALRVEHGTVIERFQTLVNCDVRMPRHIAKFTGITQEMIDAAPHVAQVFPNLLDFIGTDPVIAHNAAFDAAFMAHECDRLGLRRYPRDFICTVRIARQIFPELRTHALGALACKLGLEFTPGAHRAGTDAEVTAAVLRELSKLLGVQYPTVAITAETLRCVANGLELESNYIYSAA
jgi:DNA polymerase-3 subunit epsilon